MTPLRELIKDKAKLLKIYRSMEFYRNGERDENARLKPLIQAQTAVVEATEAYMIWVETGTGADSDEADYFFAMVGALKKLRELLEEEK